MRGAVRLDTLLVDRGLAASRERARALILAGSVRVNGHPVTKAGAPVRRDDDVTVATADHPYVSRGGVKLAHALGTFGIEAAQRTALDIGASTGGFTDVLLQRGAAHVVAIDVGHGQLAWSLRNDPRVTVRERTNVRDLSGDAVDPPADVCVADLSFISLRTVVPNLLVLTAPGATFVLLVKPQYEAGRARLGKGGVVRDPAVHDAVLREVVAGLDARGLGVAELAPSPLRGADGNVEFFVRARREPATVQSGEITRVVAEAQ